MSFVLDASAALAFIFPDERDEAALSIAHRLREESAIAPLIWKWEMQNAIVTVERRGRIAAELATSLLDDIASLPVTFDSGSGAQVEMARRFGISIYDALYLDLAFRRHLPLATRDERLSRAASTLDVPTI
ncbi:MAG: type II toxin-antitoxin system VapC family toxin [Vulcanimicrobiaceae bacterium]